MKVFISYSHHNKVIAKDIEEFLKNKSIRVFRDETHVKAGDLIMGDKVPENLLNSQLIVCLVSNASMLSAAVLKELTLAQLHSIKVVPVKLEPLENRQDSNYHTHFSKDCSYLNYTGSISELTSEIINALTSNSDCLKYKTVIDEICLEKGLEVANIFSILFSIFEYHEVSKSFNSNQRSLFDDFFYLVKNNYDMHKHNLENHKKWNTENSALEVCNPKGLKVIDFQEVTKLGHKYYDALMEIFSAAKLIIDDEVTLFKAQVQNNS